MEEMIAELLGIARQAFQGMDGTVALCRELLLQRDEARALARRLFERTNLGSGATAEELLGWYPWLRREEKP